MDMNLIFVLRIEFIKYLKFKYAHTYNHTFPHIDRNYRNKVKDNIKAFYVIFINIFINKNVHMRRNYYDFRFSYYFTVIKKEFLGLSITVSMYFFLN